MSLMAGNLYDALKSAGVAEELARKAAQEAAHYDHELSEIKSEMKLLKWMITFNLGLTGAILFILLKYLIK